MRSTHQRRLRIGDRVELWSETLGTVVGVIDDDQFDARFSAAEWRYLEKGTLIETDDGNLFHYPELDEDFRILPR